MRIAAIDQGTTSTRAVVFDGTGAQVVAAIRHGQTTGPEGRVEQDALELLLNVRSVLAAARASGALDGVGIDNQGESCLGWDALTGEPVGPVIVWQDSRTRVELERLKAEGAEPLSLARSGLPLDPYFSASKLAWILRENRTAQALARTGRLRLGTTDAFFLDRLTGHFATDVTTASRTGLMNLHTLTWDEDLCRLHGVPLETLPAIRSTTGSLGHVDGIPLGASVVDQQAALRGHGCETPGDLKITFGTGAFALAVAGPAPLMAPERGLLPTVAWRHADGPAVYAMDGGVYNAGSALEWARGVGFFHDWSELEHLPVDGTPALLRDLTFVPALSGLACPHWDRRAAGLLLGLGLETTRQDLLQALIEGIAFRAAEVVSTLGSLTAPHRLSIDGGVARCGYLRQMLSDATGLPVNYARDPELTARGCACLAAQGLGMTLTPPRDTTPVEHTPRGNGAALLPRFAEAVSRSRSWRA